MAVRNYNAPLVVSAFLRAYRYNGNRTKRGCRARSRAGLDRCVRVGHLQSEHEHLRSRLLSGSAVRIVVNTGVDCEPDVQHYRRDGPFDIPALPHPASETGRLRTIILQAAR